MSSHQVRLKFGPTNIQPAVPTARNNASFVGATRTALVDTAPKAGLVAPSETPRGHALSGTSGDSKLRHLGRTVIVLPRAPDSIHSDAGCRFTSLHERGLPGSTFPAPMFRHHRDLIFLRRSRLLIGPRRRRLAALRRDAFPAQLGGHRVRRACLSFLGAARGALGRHPRCLSYILRGYVRGSPKRLPIGHSLHRLREAGEDATDRLRRRPADCTRRRTACSGYTLAAMSTRSWSRTSTAKSGYRGDLFGNGGNQCLPVKIPC
ncbi:hypothetical protein J2T21_003005 [Paeniglutamicibacter psychrophenolicus]|nr:hypothetical protein [Paeniglutamicibacter psychrophenolicus]